jgi:hypothetical protein
MIWISSYHILEAHTAWSPTFSTNDCFQGVAYGSDSYPRVLPHSWPCCHALQRPFGFFHFWDAITAQHFKLLPLSLPENRVPQNPSKSIKIPWLKPHVVLVKQPNLGAKSAHVPSHHPRRRTWLGALAPRLRFYPKRCLEKFGIQYQ